MGSLKDVVEGMLVSAGPAPTQACYNQLVHEVGGLRDTRHPAEPVVSATAAGGLVDGEAIWRLVDTPGSAWAVLWPVLAACSASQGWLIDRGPGSVFARC